MLASLVLYQVLLPASSLPLQPSTPLPLPDFSWDTLPRFVHCGVNVNKLPDMNMSNVSQLYQRLSEFPLVTLEKFTLQSQPPANQEEEAKIVAAARGIKSFNTSTKVLFYHMAWQNFPQFALYNETQAHATDGWIVRADDGTPLGHTYNLSHPAMRAAWVRTLVAAQASGAIDGFFIDITPQALPDTDGVAYARNVQEICPAPNCSAPRQQALLDGLVTALTELRAATPSGTLVVCNPADLGPACNIEFFEFFGTSVDHGRGVAGDMARLQQRWQRQRHLVQARAAGGSDSAVFHAAEFLVAAGAHTYFGHSQSPGWGCSDGWLDRGVDGDPVFYERPLGAPLGAPTNTSNAAGPPGTPALGRVYTRRFAANTSVWLNLTGGWKHPRQCTRPQAPWPAVPECPQVCIAWGDGAVSAWPPGFDCGPKLPSLYS